MNINGLISMAKLSLITLAVAGSVASLCSFSNAIAGSQNQNLNVNTNVPAKCKISGGVSPINFGTYDPVNANFTTVLESTGSFDISCTKGVTAYITVDQGSHYSDGKRRARGELVTTTYLTYELYTNANHTTVWDSTPGGTVAYNATTRAMTTLTIYGMVHENQDVEAQNYIDTVVITTTF